MEKLYEERDHMAQDKAGGYYSRHVSAMTGEGLHAKSDIAGELAHRDMEIDRLDRRNDQLEEALHRIRSWCEAYPLDVFPKPDLAASRKALEDAGLSLDRISSDAMRHVVTKIAEQLRGIAV